MKQQHQQEETEQTLPRVHTPPAEEAVEAPVESAETDLTAHKIEVLGAAVRRRKRLAAWMRVPVAAIAILCIAGNNDLFVLPIIGLLIANYLGLAAILWGMVKAHNKVVESLK